jgi:hypothetical protein
MQTDQVTLMGTKRRLPFGGMDDTHSSSLLSTPALSWPDVPLNKRRCYALKPDSEYAWSSIAMPDKQPSSPPSPIPDTKLKSALRPSLSRRLPSPQTPNASSLGSARPSAAASDSDIRMADSLTPFAAAPGCPTASASSPLLSSGARSGMGVMQKVRCGTSSFQSLARLGSLPLQSSQPQPSSPCYFCMRLTARVDCERCERGVCDLCARACDACCGTMCRACCVVDYSHPRDVEQCFDCLDGAASVDPRGWRS